MSSATQTALKIRSRTHEATPSDLELNAVDMEVAADAESVLIDARGNFVFTAWVVNTDVAATLGTFSLFCDLYERDGTTLIEAVELYSAQLCNGTNTVKILFGEGVTARKVGTCTIGTEVDSLKLVHLFKLRLVKDTPADGACTVDVRLAAGD